MAVITHSSQQAKRIVNRRQHADRWLRDRYSAAPYVGCEYACRYSYSRARRYCPFDDPAEVSRIVRLKLNASERLRAELGRVPRRVPRHVLSTSDHQPVEAEYGLSRQMHQACMELRGTRVGPRLAGMISQWIRELRSRGSSPSAQDRGT